jgi:hypothetical protein
MPSTRRLALAPRLLAPLALVACGLTFLPAHADGTNAAAYTVYKVGFSGGEPSVGYDNVHNAAIYGAGLSMEKLTWDDSTDPPTYTNAAVPKPPSDVTTLDAITTVDPSTGRLFNSQLAGLCSLMSYSDDDGATWTQSQGCGENTLLDHQSVGVGPFHAPLDANPASNVAVYYCAQNGFNGACAVSLDGGRTFGPGRYAYNTPANAIDDPSQTIEVEGGACSALHGHLKVGPDGTAYLPVKGCGGTPSIENGTNTEYVGGRPALSISPDNGVTWTVHVVPGGKVDNGLTGSAHDTNVVSNPDESDSSVSISRPTTAKPAGTVYYAWEDGLNPSDIKNTDTRQAMVATYDPGTDTWGKPVDISSAMVDPHTGQPLQNVMFPVVVSGDPDRAVVAFLGTSQVGDTQTNAFTSHSTGTDVWDMYVASTFDGGQTWSTVDATPDDPAQLGCIDMQGTTIPPSNRQDVCGQRNLLDFNDITVDNQGRPIVAYSDGCESSCPNITPPKSSGAVDKVLRLTSGKGLYAQYDGVLRGSGPGGPVLPETPLAVLLPLVAAAGIGATIALRRRRTGSLAA